MAEIQKRKRKEYEEYTPAQKAAYQKAFQEAYERELPRQQERMRYDADRNAHIQQVFQTKGRDAARAEAVNRVILEQNNRRMMPSAREIDTKFKEFGRQALSGQRLFDMIKPEQAKERDAQRAAAEREKEARWYEQNAAAYGALDDSGKSAVERANEASDRWDAMQANMMMSAMDTSGFGLNIRQQMELVDAYKERQAATAALEQAAGENAKAVARYAEQMKNAEYAEAFAKDARQGADEHPVLHNAASVVSNALNLPAALDYGKQWARNTFTDDYAPIDVNTPEQLMGLYRDTVRDETGKNIEESLGGGFGGKAASFVYQTGMSWADSLANMAMSGGNAALSGVLMGSGAMASTVRSAKEKGASDSQAMGAGIAAGFFEGLFEQYSIENLSWMAKSDPRSFLDVVKNLGKSILGEGSEELFTELANIAADTLIMGDLSDYNLGVQQYIAQGASEKEAKQHAAADLAVQAGLAFAGGALMGMGSAGAGMTYNTASNRYTAPRAVESGEFYNALQYGLAQGEDTDAGRLARELAGKDTAGNADVMRMLREAYDQQEEDAERRAEPRVNALLRDAALKRTEIAQQEAAAEPDAHTDEAAARAAMQAAEAAQETRSKPDRETALPKAETPNSAVQADISEQDRSIMEEYFKGDVDRATYERGYEVFKRLGELGMDYDEAVAHAGAYASTLGKKYEPALRVANARGLKQRKALQAAQSTPDVQAEVHYGENAQENTPEVLQNVYTLLAKKTGQAVQVSDALSDGRGREANGAFSQKMGAFFFSTQAGNRYETVAHELFEYGRAYNPEGMARAEHAMLGMLAKKNGFANDTNGIDQMISAYQKRYGGTYADAAGEMVNDALSGTFSEDGGVEQLVRWMSEDGGYTEQEKKNVLQTLADWLKKLVDSLREYIASVGHGTAGAEAGARLQNAEQLRAQVLAELDRAVETRDTLAKKNAPASAEASDGGAVKYSLDGYSEHERENWAKSSRIVVYENDAQLERFIHDALDGKNLGQKMYFGKIPVNLAEKIYSETGLDVSGYNSTLRASEVKKILQYSHGDEATEIKRGQRAITIDDLKSIPQIIQSPDKIELDTQQYEGKPVIRFVKTLNGRTTVVTYVSKKHHDLTVQTMYAGAKKETPSPAANAPQSGPTPHTSETNRGTVSSINSIPQPGENATDDSAKFSLPGVETSSEEARRLAWENQQLAQQVEALKDEFKLTKGHRVSDRAIDLVAGRMLRETKSGYDRSALNGQLRGLFDYIANGENVVWDDVMDVAAGIARGVLSKSSEMDDTLYNEYKDMRDYFRTTKIRVTENVRTEIEATYGSYETFRRANFGRMALSTEDGTPLDALWGEISEKWPGMFDADTNELEQVFRVEEALDMVRPSYVNPYGLDMDGAAYELAQRMYEWYFTLPEVHTFADKQREKLVKTRIRMTEQRKTALEKQKARYDGRIRELREANAAQRKKASERMIRQRAVMMQSKREQALARRKRAKRSKHISRIKNNVWDLTKRLERPTDKKNIPEEMRGPILRFLNSIDFNTSREGTQAAEKWKSAAESIKLMLERAEAGKIDGYEGDPGLTAVINGLTDAKNGIASLGDATLDQLEDLDLIVRVLKGMVVKYGQTLANKKFKTAAALGNATIAELDAHKEHGTVKTMEKISDMLNEDMVNPMDWFTRMGGAAESVWKELRDGFNRRVWHLKDAQEFMEKTLDGVRAKELRQWTGDSAKAAEFQVSNGVMRLKPAQVMELYVLNQREQARKHLYGDGIRVAGYVKAGRKTVRQMKTYKVTPEQVAAITGTLTDKQRQVADAMQKYLSNTVAEWGNETSLSMYGYRKFTEENYWTIHVDETQTDTKDSTANQTGLYHIANMGASKPTSEKAKNALMLDDAFDTFTRHVSDMATYNAWAEATKDAMRWYNYQDHETGGSVKKSIQQAYGNAALRYFEKLMQDVNGITGDVGTAFGALDDKMMSKMKAAAVGANLRVIIQQPTAYMRAAAVLPPKYLATGLAHIRSGMKKVQQHSAISVWKDWGYFETAIGKNMRNVMVGGESVLEKVRDITMKPAGFADSVTWGALWSACEAYVKDTQTDLDAGSEAFYTAVSEKMDEVVDRTQVVDTVLHRSHIMRNQDRISRAATAFMSEPMKSYNMVLTALRDVRDGKPGAKKALGHTLAAYALSAAATAAAAGLLDALRDDDEDKEFDEKYLDALRVNFVDNVIMVNNIPFVKDIFSMAQGYDVGRDDLAVFETATQLIQTLLKVREGESKTTWYKVSYSAAKLVSLGTGLGFNNILRDLRAFYDNVTGFKDPLHIHASITWQNRDMLKAIDVDDMKRAQDVLDVLWERKVAEYTAKGEEKPRDAAKSALKAAVTAEYKEAYIGADSAGRAAIEEKLTALMTGGEALYDAEDIRKWLGDKYIAQKLGVSEETLKAFNAMLEETGADEDGRVSSVEALEAASRLGVSDSDKAALWKKYASERQKEKYNAAQQRGLGNAYLDILSAVGTNPKQEELYAYLRRGGYSDGQREALWEIVGGWKISYEEYGQKH